MNDAMVRASLEGRKLQTRRIVKPQPSDYEGGCHPAHTPKHPAPYFDAYCNESKTPLNPRGMSDYWCWWTEDDRQGADWIRCPYGHPGDRLYVREAHLLDPPNDGSWDHWLYTDGRIENIQAIPECFRNPAHVMYRATAADPSRFNWRPSIHMPRWASRITLEIESVRVERLQDISEEDAIAEGLSREWCDDQGETPGRWLYFTSADKPGKAHAKATDAFRVLWESINGKGSWERNDWVWVVEFRKLEGSAK